MIDNSVEAVARRREEQVREQEARRQAILRERVRIWSSATDEELFNKDWAFSSDEEVRLFKAEKTKREKRIEEAKLRIEREQLERTKQRKDGLAYSDALATEICALLSAGGLLSVVCSENDKMPSVIRCHEWLREHSDFRALYEQALQDRLEIFADEIISIPDSAARDFDIVTTKGVTRRILDPAKITAAKLRVECRRLHLVSGKPQKWGSLTTVVTRSEDGFDVSGLSAEDLENQISEYERKSKIVRVA
jgi:hypothetical protein